MNTFSCFRYRSAYFLLAIRVLNKQAGEQLDGFQNAAFTENNGIGVSIAIEPGAELMNSQSELAEILEEYLEPLTEKGFDVLIAIGDSDCN